MRQLTSKVLGLEDRMCNSFLLGELIELLPVEGTGHALEEVICYLVILFGNSMMACSKNPNKITPKSES